MRRHPSATGDPYGVEPRPMPSPLDEVMPRLPPSAGDRSNVASLPLPNAVVAETETPPLVLQPLREEHVEGLSQLIASDTPENLHYYINGGKVLHQNPDRAAQYLRTLERQMHHRLLGAYHTHIVPLTDGKPVGLVTVAPYRQKRRPVGDVYVAYWFTQQRPRKSGLATRSVAAAISSFINKGVPCQRFIAYVLRENQPSQRLMERLRIGEDEGFRRATPEDWARCTVAKDREHYVLYVLDYADARRCSHGSTTEWPPRVV